jgi:hypothetical protein
VKYYIAHIMGLVAYKNISLLLSKSEYYTGFNAEILSLKVGQAGLRTLYFVYN